MAKATQIIVPPALLGIGGLGPFSSGNLPSALTGYLVDFTNDLTWPASGDVITVTIEQSNDAGANWAFDASITLAGGVWTNRQGTVVHTSGWEVSLDNQGSTTRRVRISANVLQACTLGATVSSL